MSAPVRIPKSTSSPIAKASSKSSQPRTPTTCSSTHASPKHQSPSSSSSSASLTKETSSSRRYSRPDLMSSSLKSQDDYLVYEIPSADPESGLGSVVIIPKSSQGFSWNEDVFLSKYQLNLSSPTRLSGSTEEYHSSDDGREEDFVDVYEIHIENEPWWDDLEL